MNDTLLALDDPDLKALILRPFEDFIPMKAEECLCCVLANYAVEAILNTRLCSGKTLDIPMSGSRRTDTPPGCKSLNRERS